MCSFCEQTNCPPTCPNYDTPKYYHRCSLCGGGIYDGDEYIENIDGDCIHFDCVCGIRWLVEWLGYDVKEAKDFKCYRE